MAEHVHAVFTEGRLDAASVLAMSLSRDHHAIRAVAAHQSLSPDLLWLASELAASPYVHALERAVLTPSSDPALAAGLDAWRHGYCPLCGSWPAVGEVVSHRRLLRCSFCALAWELPDPACVYPVRQASNSSGQPPETRRPTVISICATRVDPTSRRWR